MGVSGLFYSVHRESTNSDPTPLFLLASPSPSLSLSLSLPPPGVGMKIPQLLQHFEHLVSPLAQALHYWTEEFGAKGVTAEVVRSACSAQLPLSRALSITPSS